MDLHVIADAYPSFNPNLGETSIFLCWPTAYQTLFAGAACSGQIYTHPPGACAFPLPIPSRHPASLVTFPPVFFLN